MHRVLTLVVGPTVVVSGLAIIFVLGLRTKSMLLLRPLFLVQQAGS